MGKRKKGCGRQARDNRPSALGSDDETLYENDRPDPESKEYVYDEIDNFHERREKIMLEKGTSWQRKRQDSEEEEEVLPLDVDSDDEDDDEDDEPIDMASDIEDANDDLPNDKAWGKKKSMYYSTDYVDEDFGGFDGSDAELAEEEEKEALALQQRLTAHLDDADFALDLIKVPTKEVAIQEKVDVAEKVEKDFTKLTSREKLELLQKESPELLGVIEDFKKKMSEIRDRLGKLKELVDAGKIPPGPGANYITTKYHLILNYCINVSFYMLLKAQRAPVQNHPVVKRMVNFRNLLNQLEEVDRQLEPEMDSILKKLDETGDFLISSDSVSSKKPKRTSKLQPKSKRVKFSAPRDTILDQDKELNSQKEPRKRKRKLMETEDEQEALALYELMKEGHRKSKEVDSDEEQSADLRNEYEATEEREDEKLGVQEKRSITYQIAKNKGLTPHRKKEQRNPRVKHREKFRKAKIRRKGHYREPRKELSRYGGEISGIKASVRKSIKLS